MLAAPVPGPLPGQPDTCGGLTPEGTDRIERRKSGARSPRSAGWSVVNNALRIARADARFQQWQALLTNRSKRQRAGEFLVQGVRPITLALEHGWPMRAMIHDADRPLSQWASRVLDSIEAQRVAMAPDLLGQLAEKEEPELVAVAALPPDDLARLKVGPRFLGAVFDRPSVPGNIGTLVRSVDAFGGAGMIVTGHAADPYDPRRCVLPPVRCSRCRWCVFRRTGTC